jgi:8-oxo-dGTP pyrophosphatase MutT (NUDIX family)
LKEKKTGLTVRVAVIIEQDGRILLASHSKRGTDYWVLPGGRLRSGEGVLECGAREILEETGLSISVGPLVYIGDFSGEGFQVLDLIFAGKATGGELSLGKDPEDDGRNRVLRGLKWHSPAELRESILLPENLKQAVLKDWPRGFKGRGIYIGSSTEEG